MKKNNINIAGIKVKSGVSNVTSTKNTTNKPIKNRRKEMVIKSLYENIIKVTEPHWVLNHTYWKPKWIR